MQKLKTTYPQIQAIPHTADYLKAEQETKHAFKQFFKAVGFVAVVTTISENELLGFSFFYLNIMLGVVGVVFAFNALQQVKKSMQNSHWENIPVEIKDNGYNPTLNHIAGSSYRIFN